MHISSYVKIILLLLLGFTANAQINVNTNFEILGNIPHDTRDTLTTLADTTNKAWPSVGPIAHVLDIDQHWYYNGTYWKPFSSLSDASFVNDTLYLAAADTTYAFYLGDYNDNIYTTDGVLPEDRVVDADRNRLLFKDFFFELGTPATENLYFGNAEISNPILIHQGDYGTVPNFDTTDAFVGVSYKGNNAGLAGVDSYVGMVLDTISGSSLGQIPVLGSVAWVDLLLGAGPESVLGYQINPYGRYAWVGGGTNTLNFTSIESNGSINGMTATRMTQSGVYPDSVAAGIFIESDSIILKISRDYSTQFDYETALRIDSVRALHIPGYEEGTTISNTAYAILGVDNLGKIVPIDTAGFVSGIGGLENVVEDLTPELGGDLDALNNELLNVDAISFNLSPSAPIAEGTIMWNPDDGTINIGQSGGVILQVGQEQLFYIRADADIDNGQVVMATGSIGASGKLTGAASDVLPEDMFVIGIATQDILLGNFGYVTSFGLVRGIQTDGVNYGETWNDGDILYNDPDVAGGLTNVEPPAPEHVIIVAMVVNAHATNGSIFVRVDHGVDFNNVHDVATVDPLHDALLVYDSLNGYWENSPITISSLGATTVQQNGTTISGPSPYLNFDSTYIKLTENATDSFDIKVSSPLADIVEGLAYDKLSLDIVNTGGTLYLEVERLGGGDARFMLGGQIATLDCTTGPGTGGKARVALTAGTDARNPALNYFYVTASGSVASLNQSANIPTGAFTWVGKAVVPDITTWTSEGEYAFQRFTESINDNRGQIVHERLKIRLGMDGYESGVAQSYSVETGPTPDSIVYTVTGGQAFQMHIQNMPAFPNNDRFYYGNGLGIYERLNNLNEAVFLSDSTAITNNDYYNVVIWGAINIDSATCKLYVNVSDKVYSTQALAEADGQNSSDYSVPKEMKSVAFLIGRLVLRYQSAGGGTFTILNHYDLRGQPIGSRSGGTTTAPSVANDFPDGLTGINIFDLDDPTRRAFFNSGLITTATDRTYTFPDKDITFAGLDDLGDSTIYNTNGTFSSDRTAQMLGYNLHLIGDGGDYIIGDTTGTKKKYLELEDGFNPRLTMFAEDASNFSLVRASTSSGTATMMGGDVAGNAQSTVLVRSNEVILETSDFTSGVTSFVEIEPSIIRLVDNHEEDVANNHIVASIKRESAGAPVVNQSHSLVFDHGRGSTDINLTGIKSVGTVYTTGFEEGDLVLQATDVGVLEDKVKISDNNIQFHDYGSGSITGTESYALAVDVAGNVIETTLGLTSAITTLNGETGASQTLVTGTAGTDFNIASASNIHTFNLPSASTTARGLVTTATQSFAGTKRFAGNVLFGSASVNPALGLEAYSTAGTPAIQMRGGSVSQPFSIFPSDAAARIIGSSATAGGVAVTGIVDSVGNFPALNLIGYFGGLAAPITGPAIVTVKGFVEDGIGNQVTPTATDLVFQIQAGTSTDILNVMGDGQVLHNTDPGYVAADSLALTNKKYVDAAISGAAEINDLSSIVTWANVPDANITQSSVTQHQAAIDHDLLLNFVANEHINWTNTSSNLITTGNIRSGSSVLSGSGPYLDYKDTGVTWTANQLAAWGVSQNRIGIFNTVTGAEGGFGLKAYTDATTSKSFWFQGYMETESTSEAPFQYDVFKHDGVGALEAISSAGMVMSVQNNNTEIMSLYGDGKLSIDGDLDLSNDGSILDRDGDAGTTNQVLVPHATSGLDWVDASTIGDNLGNHIATQNIETGTNWISNDGDNEGLSFETDGEARFTQSSATMMRVGYEATGDHASVVIGKGQSATTGYDLTIKPLITDITVGSKGAISVSPTYSPASAPSGSGVGFNLNSATTGSFTPSGVNAMTLNNNHGASANMNDQRGISMSLTNSGANNVVTAYGTHLTINETGTGNVDNAYGYYIAANVGSMTNFHGFRVLNQTSTGTTIGYRSDIASGANRWGAYFNGTANNYFEGFTGIGRVNPGYQLDVEASGTGSPVGSFRDGSGSVLIYSNSILDPESEFSIGSNTYGRALWFRSPTANDIITIQGTNVGINDNTPSYDLDVAGDIRLTGLLRADSVYTNGNLYFSVGDTNSDTTFFDGIAAFAINNILGPPSSESTVSFKHGPSGDAMTFYASNVRFEGKELRAATGVAIRGTTNSAKTKGIDNSNVLGSSGFGIYNNAVEALSLNTSGDVYANQLLVFDNESAEPSGIEGAVFYDTDDSQLKLYTGAAWELIGGGTAITDREIAIGNGTGITSESTFEWSNTGILHISADAGVWNIGIGESTTMDGLDASSNYNIAIGRASMSGVMSAANQNTSVGYSSMTSLTSGDNNVSIGYFSSLHNTTGSNNTYIGGHSGYFSTAPASSVGVGRYAGALLSSGTGSTFGVSVGENAGRSMNSSYFTMLGGNAGYASAADHTYLHGAVGIGYRAWYNVATNNDYGIAIGYQASDTEATYTDLIVIGAEASATQSNQIVLGHEKVGYESTQLKVRNYKFNIDETVGAGQDNYVLTYDNGTGEIGLEAGGGTAITDREIAIGNGTGITSESGLLFTTDGILEITTDLGTDNIGMGSSTTMQSLDAVSHHNLAIGVGTMAGTMSAALQNTAVGKVALASLTSGDANTALGYGALNDMTTGLSNIGIGISAGEHIINGSASTYVGGYAGYLRTASSNSTFVGYNSGRLSSAVVGGTSSVGVGYRTASGSTSSSFTALGRDAAYTTTDVDYVDGGVFVGYEAFQGVALTNHYSIGIGYQAGKAEATYNDLIIIGAEASATQSNQIVIGHEKAGYESTQLKVRNFKWDIDQTVGASQDNYAMIYDNSDGEVSLEDIASNVDMTQWLTNTTFDSPNDFVPFYDASTTTPKKVTIQNLFGGGIQSKTPAEASTTDFDMVTMMKYKWQVTMSSITAGFTITISNPTAGGEYMFHFISVTGTDAVTFPTNVKWMDETSVGTINITAGTKYSMYYDGTNFYME